MNAPDEQSVAQRLSGMGYSLKAIYATGKAAAKSGPAPSRSAAGSGTASFPVSVAPSVSLRALVVFYRQLATLVRSGISVAQALDDVCRTTRNRKLRRACEEIMGRVRSGEKLSAGMAAYPHLLPVHSTGLIWGGELGGYLDVALEDAATEIEQEAKDRRYASIGWFIAKMSLVLLIVLIPMMDLKALMVSGLTQMAEMAGNPVSETGNNDLIPPGVTFQYIIEAISLGYWTAFKRFSLPAFLIWIVAALSWSKLKRTPGVKRSIDTAILNLPAWGSLHRERSIERFLKSLHRQYRSGVAPAPAWAAASMSVRNSELAARLRGLDEMLRQPGGTLQQAFLQSGVFSQEDAGMIGSGEKAGSVPEMLERLAEYHSDAAGGAKNKGRLASVHFLLLFILISTGYVLIKVVQNYFALVFDAPKLLGLE